LGGSIVKEHALTREIHLLFLGYTGNNNHCSREANTDTFHPQGRVRFVFLGDQWYVLLTGT
jgi:hypothetical protein